MALNPVQLAGLIAILGAAGGFTGSAKAADWPLWGGQPSRNMVSSETNLPDWFDPHSVAPASFRAQGGHGRHTESDSDQRSSENSPPPAVPGAKGHVKWIAQLGTHCYGSPVIAGGKVFVGANADTPYNSQRHIRGGSVLCFDEASGKFLWQLTSPKCVTTDPLFNFDHLNLGVCSTAAVEGHYLYVVSNRDEALCLDTEGQANGNEGPFQNEAEFSTAPGAQPVAPGSTDGDIVWRCDLLTDKDVEVWPQDAADGSVLVLGNYLYLCPCNGVDKTHKHIPRPQAPSLIVLDKRTGKVIARDDAQIGPKIFHGEWSSPSTGVVGGRRLVFHGGGDGACYASMPSRCGPRMARAWAR